MAAENLRALFVDELRDIYDAEKQLVKALPKLAKAAESQGLKSAFAGHLDITRAHVGRLEEVFKLLNTAARGKKCEGMEGLIEEGNKVIQEMEGSVRDAALIASAQKVEHYEIATYGTLATFAEVLEMDDAKDLLGQTLDEEKEADEKLTQIALEINPEAEEGEEEDDEKELVAASTSKSSARSQGQGKSTTRSASTRSGRR